MITHAPTLSEITRLLDMEGHSIFTNGDKPFNLNIVGVRNMDAKLDDFSCWLCCFWKYAGRWEFRAWQATTYPGSYYLIDRLLNKDGAAILVPDQYRGVYQLDLHGGRYEALCQRGGSVRVYRDGDRDREFDMIPESVDNGWFGINIHSPVSPKSGMQNYVKDRVRASSAGCQVFQSVADFLEFRELCRQSRSWWGKSATYTLVERD